MFIEKANKKHNFKYDYPYFDNVKYTGKIPIICHEKDENGIEHGTFYQSIYPHLKGQGCPKCAKNKKYDTKTFIEISNKTHNHKYDYSKSTYADKRTKICIICHEKDKNGIEHGEFWQYPTRHMSGCGCPKCSHEKRRKTLRKKIRYTTETWIEAAKKTHGNKYDYSKVEYKGANEKVCIICPVHGEFWQNPSSHLKGFGCSKCGGKFILTKDLVVERCSKIFNGKYTYPELELENGYDSKITINCPIHGSFTQLLGHHLKGHGCPKCARNEKLTNNVFEERAKKIHGKIYMYDKVKYINYNTPVLIGCAKHGYFWQSPNSHLNGHGCPICKQSHLERTIQLFLKKRNIEYEVGKHFNWLGKQHIDLFIPEYNVGIECQGEQHISGKWYTNNLDTKIIERDINKAKLSKENNLKLYYFIASKKHKQKIIENTVKYDGIYTEENTFTSMIKLLNKIKDNK